METPSTFKIVFPKIRRVAIRNLSVYTQRPTISLDISSGVFCLAGANGLGKSTFIAAVNFGLTGRVPDPARTFLSVDEYYKDTETFSRNYFTGRVTEIERESAEIELEFAIGEYVYKLVRGLFEPGQLRFLKITGPKFGNGKEESPEALQETFMEELPKHMGLRSFQQFVFLQHFVLTFDERRALAFWEKDVLQAALFLAFGNNPEIAARVEYARREAERLDSLARNLNYHATETGKKLRELQREIDDQLSVEEDILVRHRALDSKRDELGKRLEELGREAGDKRLRISSLGAQLSNYRRQYEDIFAERAVQQHGIELHPLFVRSLSESKCNLCGSPDQLDELRLRSRNSSCPLCGAELSANATDPQESLAKLKEIDAEIGRTQHLLDSDNSAYRRIEEERLVVESQAKQVEDELSDLEAKNKGLRFVRDRSDSSELGELIRAYRKQIDDLHKRRDQSRADRDTFRERVKELQQELMRSYAVAESQFLPRFRELARAFLGLDLDARLETQRNLLHLVLEVEGTERRQLHDLSESQRFFLDIALRMAIGKFMSNEAGPVTMYIDTPEGSLDIAYESRAGEMFARFAEEGSNIIMTANINTSQLLRRLASRCGHQMMALERMTDWTQLSDVQVEEEGLFEEAFVAIESALGSADGSQAS